MHDMLFANLQGKRNPGTDSQSVKSFLDQVKRAKEMKIDRFDNLILTFYISSSVNSK